MGRNCDLLATGWSPDLNQRPSLSAMLEIIRPLRLSQHAWQIEWGTASFAGGASDGTLRPAQADEQLLERVRRILRGKMTHENDTAMIARQLADLTRDVRELGSQLKGVRERADTQQERAEVQQERIDFAARELNEVSARLRAAAAALQESI